MADLTPTQEGGIPLGTRVRWVDMGDGTHALVMYVGGGVVTLAGSEVDVTDRVARELGIARINASYDGVNWEAPRLDASTFAFNVIDYSHHEIHGGSGYHCHFTEVPTNTNERVVISFRTPNTAKWLHIIASVSVSGPALYQMLEAPTITDNTGGALAVYNRNRNSANTSGVWDTSQNPDVQGQATSFTPAQAGNVTGGTALTSEYMVSGARNFAGGGAARGVAEWELKPNTLYAFDVESLTNDDNYVSIELDWYEHQDRV